MSTSVPLSITRRRIFPSSRRKPEIWTRGAADRRQRADTLKRVVEKMRVELALQGVELRLAVAQFQFVELVLVEQNFP